MISNVCKIENGTRDLGAILKESKKVAIYNDLTDKQTMQLRLICEELDGMLPNIINDFSLTLDTLFHKPHTPLRNSIGLFAKHSFARTWDIGSYYIKKSRQLTNARCVAF